MNRFFFIFISIVLTLNLLAQEKEIILFENIKDSLLQIITYENDAVNFITNGQLRNKLSVKDKKYYLVTDTLSKCYAIIRISFEDKNKFSYYELFIFDENFDLVLDKVFQFHYEEPIPQVLLFSPNKVYLFSPQLFSLKMITVNGETEIPLEKQRLFLERLGGLLRWNDYLIVWTSQLENQEEKFSKVFILTEKGELVNQIKLPFHFLYRFFTINNHLYFSAYNYDKEFQFGFYQLQMNDFFNFSINALYNEKLQPELIENKVKNINDEVFSSSSIYKISNDHLVRLFSISEDEIIKDALKIGDRYYIISLNKNGLFFNEIDIITARTIKTRISSEVYPASLFYSALNREIFLNQNDRFILLKKFSEE